MSSANSWIQEPGTGRYYYISRGRDGRSVRRYEEDPPVASSSSVPPLRREHDREVPRSESSRYSHSTTAYADESPQHSPRSRRVSISTTKRPDSIARGPRDDRDNRPNPIDISNSRGGYNPSGGYGHRREERAHEEGTYGRDRMDISRSVDHVDHQYRDPPVRKTSEPHSTAAVERGFKTLTIDEVVNEQQYTTAPPPLQESWPPALPPAGLEPGYGQQENQAFSAYPNTDYETKGKGVARDSLEDSGPSRSNDARYVAATKGDVEKLDKSYQVRNYDYKKFFRVGRVFSTLWTAPFAGTTNTQDQTFQSAVTYVPFGERVHTKIRRFVVVRQDDRSCTCLPVTSYDGRGHRKHGIDLAEHGQIYSHKRPKEVKGIVKQPLKVNVSKGASRFEDPSLINYRRVYTVETNVKVKDIGELDTESRRLLRRYFAEAMRDEDSDVPSSTLPSGTQRNVDLAGVGSGVGSGVYQGNQYAQMSPGGNPLSSDQNFAQGHPSQDPRWQNSAGLSYQTPEVYSQAPPQDPRFSSSNYPSMADGRYQGQPPDMRYSSSSAQYQQTDHRLSQGMPMTGSHLPMQTNHPGNSGQMYSAPAQSPYLPHHSNPQPAGGFYPHGSGSQARNEQDYYGRGKQSFVPPVVGNAPYAPPSLPVDPRYPLTATPIDSQSHWTAPTHHEPAYRDTEEITLPTPEEVRESRRRDNASNAGSVQPRRRDRDRDYERRSRR